MKKCVVLPMKESIVKLNRGCPKIKCPHRIDTKKECLPIGDIKIGTLFYLSYFYHSKRILHSYLLTPKYNNTIIPNIIL